MTDPPEPLLLDELISTKICLGPHVVCCVYIRTLEGPTDVKQ